jgi:hypothetical protein
MERKKKVNSKRCRTTGMMMMDNLRGTMMKMETKFHKKK